MTMKTRDSKYDLIIIGGGAAAFSAAIKANMYGVKLQ
jgi:thioredoxin reductase